MSIEGGCWHDDLEHRIGLIVRAERERLARRRPDLDVADLAAVEDTLWRIADHLLLRRARQVRVDPIAAARLWDAPVRHPGVPVPGASKEAPEAPPQVDRVHAEGRDVARCRSARCPATTVTTASPAATTGTGAGLGV